MLFKATSHFEIILKSFSLLCILSSKSYYIQWLTQHMSLKYPDVLIKKFNAFGPTLTWYRDFRGQYLGFLLKAHGNIVKPFLDEIILYYYLWCRFFADIFIHLNTCIQVNSLYPASFHIRINANIYISWVKKAILPISRKNEKWNYQVPFIFRFPLVLKTYMTYIWVMTSDVESIHPYALNF